MTAGKQTPEDLARLRHVQVVKDIEDARQLSRQIARYYGGLPIRVAECLPYKMLAEAGDALERMITIIEQGEGT